MAFGNVAKLVLLASCCLHISSSLLAQGILLPATGPVNRAMSGATTGAAIESIGSMAWNPATIGGLQNELAFGFETLIGNYDISSTFPGVGTGTTSDETGAIPVPSVAWVHQLPNPYAKLGFAMYGAGGYAVNMPADPTNPILSPPFAMGGVGLGRVQTESVFLQMPIVVSLQLTDQLVVAAGPTLTIAKLTFDDNAFAAPNANGLYPHGNGTRYHFGGGAQLGMYFVPDSRWSFGANLKTPTWIEPFRYFGEDASGLPRTDEVNFDLPAMATFGAAFRPNCNVLLTSDLRFTDYNNTEGAGEPAQFQPDFSIGGLGWRSVFSAHFGARVRLTDRLYGMAGYMYLSDLIDDENTFFNIGSDLSYRHGISTGASWLLTDCVSINGAYSFFPEWTSTGPFVAPGLGPIPGSSVTNEVVGHALTFGVNVRY